MLGRFKRLGKHRSNASNEMWITCWVYAGWDKGGKIKNSCTLRKRGIRNALNLTGRQVYWYCRMTEFFCDFLRMTARISNPIFSFWKHPTLKRHLRTVWGIFKKHNISGGFPPSSGARLSLYQAFFIIFYCVTSGKGKEQTQDCLNTRLLC